MENMRMLTFLLFTIGILISFKNQNAETKKGSSSLPLPSPSINLKRPSTAWDSTPSIFLAASFFSSSSHSKNLQQQQEDDGQPLPTRPLEYDFYRGSCPKAEKIIHDVVRKLYSSKISVAPSLVRLVFHDCFIEGCDASILLDSANMDSEKDSPPNIGLKGYDIIDLIKSELEGTCPGVVSCADVIVLAAREAIVQAGGPFYPLNTGRRDGVHSFGNTATYELPSPHADLSETLASFASRGFDERETVALLGAHSIGEIHCRFFQNRLYDFGGTNKPDPSIDSDLLHQMRSKCSKRPNASPPSHASASAAAPSPFNGPPHSWSEKSGEKGSTSSSVSHSNSPLARYPSTLKDSLYSSFDEPALHMAYEGPGVDFGTLYYHQLLHGRGILYSDQQLMAGEETGAWVRAYAADASLFRKDFALAMMKLSNLQILTGSAGQVRFNCSKVVGQNIGN